MHKVMKESVCRECHPPTATHSLFICVVRARLSGRPALITPIRDIHAKYPALAADESTRPDSLCER